MTEPRDIAWARRCADDYKTNPTDARARNAAQCLKPLLDAYDFVFTQLKTHTPPELCRAESYEGLICYLATGHPGDHSTNVHHREPATWPQRPEPCPGFDGLPCFRPAGHLGGHSTAPEWLRVGIDPCPARSHQQKSCTKGYLHRGGHEWGPTKPIEAGPELPLGEPDPTQAPHNCRCVVSYQPDAPSLLELEAAHYRDTTRTMDDGKRPCEGRDCTNRTTMSCARCGRQNCRMCAAINLKTMTHSDGTPCAWRCRFPDCKTPNEDPWHLHCAAPFGMLTERRWRELNPEAPSAEI